ncbi:MAG: radical SAM protein [archaeon]
MKIKLFFAPRLYSQEHGFGYQGRSSCVPPLGLPMIKSYLESRGYQAEQDDLDIKAWNRNLTAQKIDMRPFDDRERIGRYMECGKDPGLEKEARKILDMTDYRGFDVYGFSIADDHNFSAIGSTVVLSKIIKEETGGIIVVGGLRHTRKIHETKLTDLDYIDYLVLEDHVTFHRLLTNLRKGDENERHWRHIASGKRRRMNCQSGGQLLRDDVDNRWDLGDEESVLPVPDFRGLPLEKYRTNDRASGVLIMPYSFAVGCNNGCAFCPNSYDPHFAEKSPASVVRDLSRLAKTCNTGFFLFMNTNINPSTGYCEALADRIIESKLNIKWMSCANLIHLNERLLEKLKRAGAIKLIFGLESASPHLLKYIRKGITTGRAESLLRCSHELGIWNEVELIAGLPHETDEDIQNTVDFIRRNNKYIDYFHLAKFILMDSAFTADPERFGMKNIRENMNGLRDMKHFYRSFDEIGGLAWQEKEKQIEESHRRISNAISWPGEGNAFAEQSGYRGAEDTHLLFHLYGKYGDKMKVREALQNGV